MARLIMTTLVVFFVSFNLFAGVMVSTGVADMLGMDATVGEDDAVSDVAGGQDLDTGSATDGTLFGSNNVIGAQLTKLFGVVFPGLRMLERAGVPSFLTGALLGPLFSLFTVFSIASFVRGYSV